MKIGFVMDPPSALHLEKDSSIAMLQAAQSRGWQSYYIGTGDLFLVKDKLLANIAPIVVDETRNLQLSPATAQSITDLDIILFRKDPPFDMEYIYTTYLLEHAIHQGVAVFNDPTGIRDVNEKCFITRFSDYITATEITRSANRLREFAAQHGAIIIKPLGKMGGQSIFKTSANDENLNVIIETTTQEETQFVMVQAFIPEIYEGDKRILMIDGEPTSYGLARIPDKSDFRGNLVRGATGKGVSLTARDREICRAVAPTLKEKGLIFVGLDIIGDYLTEINVTSPTGIRELDALYDLDIAGQLLDTIATKLN